MDMNILVFLQNFRNGAGSFLTEFVSKMTFFGELNTVLVIMAILYWCIDKDFGTYLLMGWSGNRLVNGFLKVTICAYRPWIRDPRILPFGDAIHTATGYSFPSGHTMNAASVYGGTAVRKDLPRTLRMVMGSLVILVAFSRIYLGVHTPQDVLAGIVFGMLTLWLISKMMHWLAAHPDKDMLVFFVGILLAAAVAVYAYLKPYPMDYDQDGKLLVDGAKMANDTFKGIGWCTAFLSGWILERRFVRFSTDVSMTIRATRLSFGLLFYYAVSLIFVPLIKAWIPGALGTLISCYVQMFYIAFLFPWCLKRLEKS